MPEMSGFEVLEQLKSDPATRTIPVIIYTSKELDDGDRARLSTDATAILFKQRTSRHMIIGHIQNALDKVIKKEDSPHPKEHYHAS